MAVRQSRRDHDEWEVYALAAGPLPRRIHVAGRSLRVFAVGPIAVIAGPPHAESSSTEDALREQHAIVLALADRVDPLLPARFGSRTTAAKLDTSLRPSVKMLIQALRHVQGRQQMTLRLSGPAIVDDPGASNPTGTVYLAQRRAAVRALPPAAAPLLAAVAPFVIEERMQPGRGAVRATLFHLVARGDVPKYHSTVEDVCAGSAITPWSAAVTGPWPPFAFAPELLG